MKFKTTLAALLFCATALASSPHKYRLVWQDDFNGTTFDSRSWTKIKRCAPDWRKYMSDADSLYAVRDGKLVLRGALNTNLEADTARFVTGGLYTKRKHAVKYGKVEVRARFDCAQGVWPAIWMKPDYEVKWPRGGEIDIIAENGEYLAFVEVKTRKPNSLTSGFDDVTAKKQARLIQTAAVWCAEHPTELQPRFDIACVMMQGKQILSVDYLENAFDTTGSDFIF